VPASAQLSTECLKNVNASAATFAVASCATVLPRRVEANAAIASTLGVSHEWIAQRCGFVARPVATDETTGSLAIEAARLALAFSLDTPDHIICATFTPDYLLCPTAPAIAHAVGLQGVPAFDVNGACTGGLVALLLGVDLLRAGTARTVLVVASDTTTKYISDDDAGCRILFGDGAAAFVISGQGSRTFKILARIAGSDGSGAGLFRVPQGGSAAPASTGTVKMDGPAVFRFAVHIAAQLVNQLCETAGVAPQEIAHVILHQANSRITSAAARLTSVPAERWVINSASTGNLASASTLVAWATHTRCFGPSKAGEKIILATFGAGLTWAGALLEC
jgi:3-oxoacyl-[acyl-carrier-protein] synthase-3